MLRSLKESAKGSPRSRAKRARTSFKVVMGDLKYSVGRCMDPVRTKGVWAGCTSQLHCTRRGQATLGGNFTRGARSCLPLSLQHSCVGPERAATFGLLAQVEKTAADDRLEVRNTGDPDGVPKRQCPLVRERVVWRIEKGKSVHVGHCIFAGADEVRKDRESMATWPRNWYNP